MKFWDSSAVLPLALRDPASERVEPLLREDGEIVLWWGTPVECASALSRANENHHLTPIHHRRAQAVLESLRSHAFEIQPLEEVRARALRVLDVHSLSHLEAFQLAAALVWCRERTRGVGFVSLDEQLRQAALREGFHVLPEEGGEEE